MAIDMTGVMVLAVAFATSLMALASLRLRQNRRKAPVRVTRDIQRHGSRR
jgi:hypothetical protein